MFKLPKLAYDLGDFAPYISERTMDFHYNKHHHAYINRLNDLIKETEFADKPLEEIILQTHNKPQYENIYNNAGQAWNHNLWWQSIFPYPTLSEKTLVRIKNDFGSLENLKNILKEKSLAQFGSGWVWIAETEQQNLQVYSTSNADNPLLFKHKALLTIDVWEHAYYLDYQNMRATYADNVIDYVLNYEKLAPRN